MIETSTIQDDTLDKTYLSRALEVSIHVGLFILLATACLLILRPFLPLTAWGIIIAIAAYPGYRRLKNFLGGRNGLAAVVCTLLLLAVLIVPVVLLTGSLVEGAKRQHASMGTLIPPPPQNIETWPVTGLA
jgi:predicted PurR-regulated permease PerM